MQDIAGTDNSGEQRLPGLGYAIFVLVLVFAILIGGLVGLGAPIQIMMLISFIVAIPLAMRIGYTYKEVENFAFDLIRRALQAVLIYLAVGALIGAWILSGTVPTMIYAGLAIISPKYFLLTALVLCALTSLFVGTSFGTIGTMGLALIGVAATLNLPLGLAAGAIISGAIFGDKMSPLSDTTNLAPAVCGSELISHIKHMMWTTIPALIITAILFTVIGLNYGGGTLASSQVDEVASTLSETFKLGFVPMIPAIVVLALLLLKQPAFTSIFIGALVGALVAVPYQGSSISDALSIMYNGYEADTGVEIVDGLLTTGGVVSFLGLVALVLAALGLGGILSGSGILQSVLNSFSSRITSDRRLVVATLIVTFISNVVGSAINVALVIAGTLMFPLYEKSDLELKNLSRAIEDAGTMTGFIIPWNLAAIFAAGALGVSPFAFIPFCFICFLTPLISLIYGLTGFTLTKKDASQNYS